MRTLLYRYLGGSGFQPQQSIVLHLHCLQFCQLLNIQYIIGLERRRSRNEFTIIDHPLNSVREHSGKCGPQNSPIREAPVLQFVLPSLLHNLKHVACCRCCADKSSCSRRVNFSVLRSAFAADLNCALLRKRRSVSIGIIYNSWMCIENGSILKIPDASVLGGFPAVDAGDCVPNYGT